MYHPIISDDHGYKKESYEENSWEVKSSEKDCC